MQQPNSPIPKFNLPEWLRTLWQQYGVAVMLMQFVTAVIFTAFGLFLLIITKFKSWEMYPAAVAASALPVSLYIMTLKKTYGTVWGPLFRHLRMLSVLIGIVIIGFIILVIVTTFTGGFSIVTK